MDTIYISENGSDLQGNGKLKNPVATFEKALELACQRKGKPLPWASVLIRF